jgi:hypothetical protein
MLLSSVSRDVNQETLDKLGSLSGIVDNHTSQLTETEKENRIYRKKVFKILPFRFPDYDNVLAKDNIEYMSPQGFTIDWLKKEIFVMYWDSGNEGAWIAVFDLDSSEYMRCFRINLTVQAEGIVLKYRGSMRYLYTRTRLKDSESGYMGEFDVSNLPNNLSYIEPDNEYEFSVGQFFNYYNERWIIQDRTEFLGTELVHSSVLSITDEGFNRTGSIVLDPASFGYNSGTYADKSAKSQSIALTKDSIVQLDGGFSLKNITVNPQNYQGIKRYNFSGELIEEGLIDSNVMHDILTANGLDSDFVEFEGLHVAEDGKIYSLMVNQYIDNQTSTTKGIVIFEEYSNDVEAIDFSSGAAIYPRNKPYNPSLFQVSGGRKMYNPIDGKELNSLDGICTYMLNTRTDNFSFYTSVVDVQDFDNTTLPWDILVTIRMANRNTFYIDYKYKNKTPVHFVVSGESGSRIILTLTDEQSGNFTPKIESDATNANTYGWSSGRYHKRGKLVFVEMDISMTALDSNHSGVIKITGLPFTNVGFKTPVTIGRSYGLPESTSYIVENANHIVFLKKNTRESFVMASDITSGVLITISASYITTE